MAVEISEEDWAHLYATQNSNGCYMLAIEEMRKKFMNGADPQPITEAFRDKASQHLLHSEHGKTIMAELVRRIAAAGRQEILTDGTGVFYCDIILRNVNASIDTMAFSFVIPKE